MTFRFFFAATLAVALTACSGMHDKKSSAGNRKSEKSDAPKMADVSGDVAFQAFLGRLRKAVAAHDAQTVASMMTPDFGYRLEPPGEGDGVFQYWDEKGLWDEVQAVLGERFVPKGNFMVAPMQFAIDPDYHGYRAGVASVNGSWKFAYFVTD